MVTTNGAGDGSIRHGDRWNCHERVNHNSRRRFGHHGQFNAASHRHFHTYHGGTHARWIWDRESNRETTRIRNRVHDLWNRVLNHSPSRWLRHVVCWLVNHRRYRSSPRYPAVVALAAINYTGRDRAFAYAMLGGVAGAAAAAGPLIGGWVTSEFSWQWVFAAETLLIVVLILPLASTIKDIPVQPSTSRFDLVGVVLSAASMGTVVLALVSASTWGLLEPLNPPFQIAGFSPTIPIVLAGLGIGWAFISWERHIRDSGRQPLLGIDLFSLSSLRAGLVSQTILYFIIAGSFFVLPLYLQTVLNLDAFESGIRMLPMSISVFVLALAGSRLALHFSPLVMIRSGLVTACFGLLLLIGAITPQVSGTLFTCAMTAIGIGIGLAISQIGNVNLSCVDDSRSNEVGGLQGTATNLGSSLGVALAGTVLFIGLATTFTSSVLSNDNIDSAVAQSVADAAASGVQIVTLTQAQEALTNAGVSERDAAEIVQEYAASKVQSLRAGLGVLFIIGLIGIPLTRGLPNKPIVQASPIIRKI